MITDTHTHIYSEEFDDDIEIVLERAKQNGVNRMLLPNIDSSSIDRIHRLYDKHPECCYPMMGLHPTSVDASWQEELTTIGSYFGKRPYVAVGEIGIDLYWDKTYLKEQMLAFEEQLKWSIEYNLPVVIHNRDAFSQVMECLNKVGVDRLRGVFHSFGGSLEELETIIGCKNFMIGINGVITFKKSTFREYLNLAPLERILVETDAPYLAPVPYRGKRNEPVYIRHTIETLSEVYQLPFETIAAQTAQNASALFSLT